MRYIIEGTWGTWSGYTGSQSRVVHREVTTNRKFAWKVRDLRSITFTDGTALFLDVRPTEYRERVAEINGYRELIRDCVQYGAHTRRAEFTAKVAGAK